MRYMNYVDALNTLGITGAHKHAHTDTATDIDWRGAEASDIGGEGG